VLAAGEHDDLQVGLGRLQRPQRFEAGKFPEACDLFVRLSTSETCPDFLTLPAYAQID